MKTIARFSPLLAMLLCLAAPAMAQNQYRIEAFGAGYFPHDYKFEIGPPQFSPPLEGAHEYSAGARGGVRFGADFKKYWGEDIIYSYGSNATKLVNKTADQQFPFNIRTHIFAINALWYPAGYDDDKKVAPYITGGVGGTFFVLSNKTINAGMEAGLGQLRTENLFAFNAGGGLSMKASQHIGFRVDARDYMSRTPRFGLPQSSEDPSAFVLPTSGVFHQIEVSFAFVYYF